MHTCSSSVPIWVLTPSTITTNNASRLPDGSSNTSRERYARQAGYEVIYKLHPDTADTVRPVIVDRVDRVVDGRFEDHCCKIDCIVFGSPATSVFGYAMLTQLPMAVINTKGNYWLPEVLELVGKRCALVPAEADQHGRIIFDSAELIDAVKRSKDLMDHSVVHEYAL